MRRFIILLVIILMVLPATAQDTITIDPIPQVFPPPGHDFSCVADAATLYYLGPNCINPVLWDIEGLHKIGGYVFFGDEAGFLVGFVWNWRTQSYDYLILTRDHIAATGYAGQWEVITPGRVFYP